MRPKHLLAAGAASIAALGVTPAADAATYCVPAASCDPGQIAKATLTQALGAAESSRGPDTVALGAGTFGSSTGFKYAGGADNELTIVGEGDQTVITDTSDVEKINGSVVLDLYGDGATTVKGVRVVVPPSMVYSAGLKLDGANADDVRVVATPPQDVPDPKPHVANDGVVVVGAATISRSDVTGFIEAVDIKSSKAVVEDSRLGASWIALVTTGAGASADLRRVEATAPTVLYATGGTSMRVSDSLLHVAGGGAGLSVFADGGNASIDASHVTVRHFGGSIGIGARATSTAQGHGRVRLDNSILATPIALSASGSPNAPTDGLVVARSSAYDVGSNDVSAGGATDQSGIVALPNPLFTPQFKLPLGSPLIDAGRANAFVPSTTDLWGNARKLDGDGDGVAEPDMGAHERPAAQTIASPAVRP